MKFQKVIFICIFFSVFSFPYPQEDCNGSATDNSDVKGENAGNANDSRTGGGVSVKYLGVDHFNNEESNPVKTNALSKYYFQFT